MASGIEKAASFSGVSRRYGNAEMIVNLLTKAIKDSRVVTKHDIVECYLDYVFNSSATVYRKGLDNSCYFQGGHNGVFTRAELKSREHYIERMSIDWFKKNLGTAILQGRLLAIPVINIEETKTLSNEKEIPSQKSS